MPGQYAQAILIGREIPEVEGHVVNVSSRPAPWDATQQIPVVVLRLADGTERSVHGVKSSIRWQLEEIGPMIGEQLRVRYEGEQVTAAGRAFSAYTVEATERERPAA